MSDADARQRARVLVIEDNNDLRENLAEILERCGYEVATAPGAKAGLERLAEAPTGVVLLDLNLGDGSGLDLLAAVKRGSPETEVVILTGNASLESAIEAVNRGAYAYLGKGGRIEDVIASIDRAAEKVRLKAEARRLEAELRRERNFSRAVLSNMARGIAVVGAGGAVLELNRRMRELLRIGGGGAAAEGAARPATDAYPDQASLAALGKDDEARDRIRAAFSSAADHDGVEVEVRLRDGSAGIWSISTSHARSEAGAKDVVIAVVTDVTVERELQRRIVESTRLAAIGEMAARVAHEVRNPLAGIAGALRVLARADEPAEKREAFSRELLALVGRLNAFVEDLLVHARPLRVAREDVKLEQLVAGTLAVMREHPAGRGVAIEVDDRLGRALRIDPHHMAMVMQNLVLNAAQAMRGKGRVRIEARPSRRDPAQAVVTVTDDGPGIREDIVPRLFEAFATTRPEGTGLGLSTVKRIVEAHGGSVSATNMAGGGARFEVRVPG